MTAVHTIRARRKMTLAKMRQYKRQAEILIRPRAGTLRIQSAKVIFLAMVIWGFMVLEGSRMVVWRR